MINPLPIHVISLKHETKRRTHINQSFSDLNINFNFFDAIDKSIAQHISQEEGLSIQEGVVTLGELGCFLSHYLLWKQMINNNLPYMVIFEDDVILSPNIVPFFQSIDEIMQTFDVIKLETMLTPTIYQQPSTKFVQFEFLKMQTEHMGLAGYVLTQNIAKELINAIQKDGITKPIDHYVFRDLIELHSDLKIYQISPALAIQEDVLNATKSLLTSSLEKERRIRMNSPAVKIKGFAKLRREIKRIFIQLTFANLIRKYRRLVFNRKATIIEFDQ